MKKNVLDAKEVVTEIKGSWDIILRQCIPHTVIYMLPLFAVSDTGNAPIDETLKKRTAHATACYDLLTKEATKEVIIMCKLCIYNNLIMVKREIVTI